MYDIFISYRRRDTGDKAEHLKDLLEPSFKKRISFDRENLTGIFDVELADRIDHCRDFLLVLGKNSLVFTDEDFTDEKVALYDFLGGCTLKEFEEKITEMGYNAQIDFVRIEIARALRRKDIRIIPIVPESSESFNFSKMRLPADIIGLKRYESVFYSDSAEALFKDVLPKVMQHMQSKPDRNLWSWVTGVGCLVAVLCGLLLGKQYFSDRKALEQSVTYSQLHEYKQAKHLFFNGECDRRLHEFVVLERGGYAYVNNTSGQKPSARDSLTVVWSPEITLTQVRALVGMLDSMMLVPAGKFVMGLDEKDALDIEFPRHEVTISNDFYVSKYELTRDLWAVVMSDSVAEKDKRMPMTGISWNDCRAFLARLNSLITVKDMHFDLPTEAEWEYSANGSSPLTFAGSANAGEVAWFEGNSMGILHRVGEKSANRFELYDMSGNVSEWCRDYASTPSKNSYRDGKSIDPTGPSSGTKHILRGGGYATEQECVAVTYRDAADSDTRDEAIGMRLVLRKN